MDEGVGEQLAGLLQVVAVLDGVGQDAGQQAHVLTLGFHVAGFEQREVGEHQGDDALLGLGLPLADHSCKETTEKKYQVANIRTGRPDYVSHLFHTSTLTTASIKMAEKVKQPFIWWTLCLVSHHHREARRCNGLSVR